MGGGLLQGSRSESGAVGAAVNAVERIGGKSGDLGGLKNGSLTQEASSQGRCGTVVQPVGGLVRG